LKVVHLIGFTTETPTKPFYTTSTILTAQPIGSDRPRVSYCGSS